MATTVEQLRDMAQECRELATAAKRPAIREQLLEMADQFERLAVVDQARLQTLGQEQLH